MTQGRRFSSTLAKDMELVQRLQGGGTRSLAISDNEDPRKRDTAVKIRFNVWSELW